jgi:high-affinity iron transporter
LFLRALWLEGGAQAKTMMALGVLSSFTFIFILAYALLRFSVKLPIQKLFNFSALLMSVLAVILTGKGLHSLQETGVLTVTASPVKLRIDLFGFYPTLETLLPQLGVVILIVGIWFYGKRSLGLKTTST